MYRGRTAVPHTPIRLYLVGVILPAVCIALVGLCSTVMGSTTPGPRSCFPVSSWQGGTKVDELRPCVRILKVQEDGSFSFAVSDANGTVRYTSGVGALDR